MSDTEVKKYYDDNLKLHRDFGPAIQNSNGDFSHYRHGLLHRDFGPAFQEGKIKRWYNDGLLHNYFGPAEVTPEGSKYFIRGKEYSKEAWEANRKSILENELKEKIKDTEYTLEWWDSAKTCLRILKNGFPDHKELPSHYNLALERVTYSCNEQVGKRGEGPVRIYNSGEEYQDTGDYLSYSPPEPIGVKVTIKGDLITVISATHQSYYNSKGLHRTDGPAVIAPDGAYLREHDGNIDRIEDSIVEDWFVNGERHRTDGPAKIRKDGSVEYWINGKFISETDFNLQKEEVVTTVTELQTTHTKNGVLHNPYGPAKIRKDGSYRWEINGKLHREDGPAFICPSGKDFRHQRDDDGVPVGVEPEIECPIEAWYTHGKKHNPKGPAVKWLDGRQEYWLDGEELKQEEWLLKTAQLFKDESVGRTLYYKDAAKSILHNSNGPAVIRPNSKEWWEDGKLLKIETVDCTRYYNEKGPHRDNDLPAVEYKNGTKEWWQNGELHRDKGPAIQFKNGSVRYYRHNKLHREDKAAYICANGVRKYYLDGKQYSKEEFEEWQRLRTYSKQDGVHTLYYKDPEFKTLHRLDGPAIEGPDLGPIVYAINGLRYTKEQFEEQLKLVTFTKVTESGIAHYKDAKCTILHRLDGPAKINGNNQYWYQNNQLHREGGPAVIDKEHQVWWVNGMRHREDGPAFLWLEQQGSDCIKEIWCKKDLYHREDGPARIYWNGTVEYWLHGKQLSKEEFEEQTKFHTFVVTNQYGTFHYKDRARTILHRLDGPAVEKKDGHKEWRQNGKYYRENDLPVIEAGDRKIWLHPDTEVRHRDDGPAYTDNNVEMWYQHGKYHRCGGPSIIYPNGHKEWHQSGKLHREDGPAIINHIGDEYYYLDSLSYSKDDYYRELARRNPQKNLAIRVASKQISQKLGKMMGNHQLSQAIISYATGYGLSPKFPQIGRELRRESLAHLGGNFLTDLGNAIDQQKIKEILLQIQAGRAADPLAKQVAQTYLNQVVPMIESETQTELVQLDPDGNQLFQ